MVPEEVQILRLSSMYQDESRDGRIEMVLGLKLSSVNQGDR